jgi:polysaccharide export outer membrane protein
MVRKLAGAGRWGMVLVMAMILSIATRAQDRKGNPPSGGQTRTLAANRSLPTSAPPDPSRVDPAYVIGPGDLLAIDVWNEPEITGKVPVRTDGKITVPLLGEVQAGGLTPNALQANVSQRLQQYVKGPAVTVAVEQMNSHHFNVLGEVEHPGSFPLAQETRVLDALAQAGGFRDFAKVTKIYVLRHAPDGKAVQLPFNYKRVTHGQSPEQNIQLQAGDTVIVP